jgi:histidinol-phosphatase
MPPLPSDLQPRLALAIEAAREAGQITLEYFRRDDLEVELKCDDTPVTAADRRAEQCLRQRIATAFPDDGILGEELGERPGTSGFRWIVDPIDGTKSFIHGVPLFGTLIGLEREGESVLGVIRIPALDECVYAARGLGAR